MSKAAKTRLTARRRKATGNAAHTWDALMDSAPVSLKGCGFCADAKLKASIAQALDVATARRAKGIKPPTREWLHERIVEMHGTELSLTTFKDHIRKHETERVRAVYGR